MTTRIADDYGDIARRLAQLQRDRLGQRFSLPEGVIIFLDKEVSPQMPKPDCDLALVLHRIYNRITVLTMSETHRVTIGSLVEVMRQQFPSVTLATKHEMALSEEDCKSLTNWVETHR